MRKGDSEYEALMQACEPAIRALAAGPPVELVIQHADAWILFSYLQLALRHPANNGHSARRARHIAERLQLLIAPEGPLATLAELGWNLDFDDDAAPNLFQACQAARLALRSYQYGNVSPDLAEEIANFIDKLLAKTTV